MAIEKVFVVGSGLMGGGIAQVCAQVGIQVFITDISQEILNKALKNISWSVGKFVEKGKLKESLETIMGRIRVPCLAPAFREPTPRPHPGAARTQSR